MSYDSDKDRPRHEVGEIVYCSNQARHSGKIIHSYFDEKADCWKYVVKLPSGRVSEKVAGWSKIKRLQADIDYLQRQIDQLEEFKAAAEAVV